MIRNRYNYPTPPIRDINGKETQTRNNRTPMETSLAESQTDSYFPTKWPNGYPKQKDVSDTHIQRRTITKINHDRRTALEWSVKSGGWGGGRGWSGGGGVEGLKSILRGHNPCPYFCRSSDTYFVQSAWRLPTHQCNISENTKNQQIIEMKQRWGLEARNNWNAKVATWEDVLTDMIAQQRLRSACAIAQPDQNFHLAHFG